MQSSKNYSLKQQSVCTYMVNKEYHITIKIDNLRFTGCMLT